MATEKFQPENSDTLSMEEIIRESEIKKQDISRAIADAHPKLKPFLKPQKWEG